MCARNASRHKAPRMFPVEGADQTSLHVLPDTEASWTADELLAATGGEWIVPPDPGWRTNGFAISPGRVRPGIMLVHSQQSLPLAMIRTLAKVGAGVLTEDGSAFAELGLPVFEVADVNLALYDLARYARDRYAGSVIALTGSVGKTGTTHLLSQVLSAFGPVEHTRASGNSPRANASLLASVSREVPFWVTEIALNNPSLISSFARPHVAIVLAISPAHLIYWKSVTQVALRKSAIFHGMEPGAVAVLNREMREYDTVAGQAREKGLRIVTFGTGQEADVCLLRAANGMSTVSIHGATHRFPCTLPPHMQRNMLAVLAAAHALGRPLTPCLAALRDPRLLPGRGRRHHLRLDGKSITLIDDSYNANPDSMRAALEGLCFAAPNPATRVAALGDIAELGSNEAQQHLDLVPAIADARLDRLFLCGPLMRPVWEALRESVQAEWFETPVELQAELPSRLRNGDVVVFKSSGHKLTPTVADLLERHRPGDPQAGGRSASAMVAFGGNVNLGRRQHLAVRRHGPRYALGAIPELAEADLSLVSLGCVAARCGTPRKNKGFSSTAFFRARPEQLAVLREAGVNLVATANNHSGDYGPEALAEELGHLASMGLAQAGSGADPDQAARPAYVAAGKYTVAVFSVDTIAPSFAAGQNTGTCYLPPCNPDLWYKTSVPRIEAAREKAHLVLFVVHANVHERSGPGRNARALYRALVDAGADGVLCTSPQTWPALEVYRERPILHGAGDLLTDTLHAQEKAAGLFTLHLSPNGISEVRFVPLRSGGGRTVPAAGDAALQDLEQFAARSRALGAPVTVENDRAHRALAPIPRSTLALRKKSASRAMAAEAPQPAVAPCPQWVMRAIELPASRAVAPVSIGPLTLTGLWVPSSCRVLRGRRTIWVESWWSIEEKTEENLLLDITAVPKNPDLKFLFGNGMQHEPCDWMWPTNRWEPGLVYRDLVGLLPPPAALLQSTELELRFRVLQEGSVLGTFTAPVPLRIQLTS